MPVSEITSQVWRHKPSSYFLMALWLPVLVLVLARGGVENSAVSLARRIQTRRAPGALSPECKAGNAEQGPLR